MIGRTNAGLAPLRPKYSIKGWTQTIGLSYSDLSAISEVDMRKLMSKHISADYFLEWYASEPEMLDMFTANEYAMKWIGQNDYIYDKLMYFGQNRDATNVENANIVGFTVPSQSPIQNYVVGGTFIQRVGRVDLGTLAWEYQNGRYVALQPTNAKFGSTSSMGYCSKYAVIANNTSMSTVKDKEMIYGRAISGTVGQVVVLDSAYSSVSTFKSAMNGVYLYYELSTPIIHNFGHSEAGDKLLASEYWPYILKDKVPIMTANDAPYGEAFADSVISSQPDRLPYKTMNGSNTTWYSNSKTNGYIGYGFTNPICVKKVEFEKGTDCIKNFIIQGSNNKDSGYVDLYSGVTTSPSGKYVCDINNDNFYLYYRLFGVDAHGSDYISIKSLQFYGRSLTVSVPTMTSNTQPYGKASASYVNEDAYKVFDKNEISSAWNYYTTNGAIEDESCYVEYEFDKEYYFKMISLFLGIVTTSVSVSGAPRFKVKYFDATSNSWLDAMDWDSNSYRTEKKVVFGCDIKTQKFRIVTTVPFFSATTYYSSNFREVNFFGVDYSDRTEREYLYDHGLKLIPMSIGVKGGGDGLGTVTENALSVTCACPDSVYQDQAPFATDDMIDISSYSQIWLGYDLGYAEKSTPKATIQASSNRSVWGGVIAFKDIQLQTNHVGFDVADISSVNGYAYICCGSRVLSDEGGPGTVDITEVWLE